MFSVKSLGLRVKDLLNYLLAHDVLDASGVGLEHLGALLFHGIQPLHYFISVWFFWWSVCNVPPVFCRR